MKKYHPETYADDVSSFIHDYDDSDDEEEGTTLPPTLMLIWILIGLMMNL